jgi:hypothetical protein
VFPSKYAKEFAMLNHMLNRLVPFIPVIVYVIRRGLRILQDQHIRVPFPTCFRRNAGQHGMHIVWQWCYRRRPRR